MNGISFVSHKKYGDDPKELPSVDAHFQIFKVKGVDLFPKIN